MAKVPNRVLETTTTTGTGTLSLNGAVTGHQTFIASPDVATGDDVWYCIVDSLSSPTLWEIGRGVVTAGSPDTLTRASVEESSNGGSLVNFPVGTKYVFSAWSTRALVDQLRSLALYLGTTAGSGSAYTLTPTQPLAGLTTGTIITFALHADCEDNATLNVSSAGAKALQVNRAGTLDNVDEDEFRSGDRILAVYDATAASGSGAWVVVAPASGASETAAGVVRLATDAEAEAGTADDCAMTPAKAAAREASLFAVTPVGAVMNYAGAAAPSGWLLCYGQAVSRSTYASLFSAIGTAYGAGDGSTTFNVPDLRGRVGVGKDDMGGSAASRVTSGGSGINGAALGSAGGTQTHVLTTTEMPSHSHAPTAGTLMVHYPAAGQWLPGSLGPAFTEIATTANAGGGGAHLNMPPSIVLNTIIFAGV